ncbi:MAG: helix-turn-helix domain-containing protein [Lachnospiraceae bacterium]|nr:helix-turn-helix domain-containing protein [Lachnospiraceae bacterium]
MFNNYDDILTITDLTEALKIGSSQAYKLVKTGRIKSFKDGKNWKITKLALIEYVKKESGLV